MKSEKESQMKSEKCEINMKSEKESQMKSEKGER